MANNLSSLALASLAAFGVAGVWLVGSGQAQAQYDNPTMGETPCVVLSRYIGDEPTGRRTIAGDRVHRAEIGVANVCGRSVEVRLCVALVEPPEGEEASCFEGLLRPWSRTEIHTIEAAAPLAGPTIEWRWVTRAEAGM